MARKKKRWWRTLAPKDWITISISFLALGVSILTAYFSFFQQFDEVSVVVENFPYLELYSKEKVSISGGGKIVLMNTGNRPAAILEVEVITNQHVNEDSDFPPCSGIGERFQTTFEPLILKPGDLVLKEFKLKPSEYDEIKNGAILFKATGKPDVWSADQPEYIAETAYLCFNFRIVTPSDQSVIANVYLGEMLVSKPGHMTILKFGGNSRPERLVRNSTNIFADWGLAFEKWWRLVTNEPESPEEENEFQKSWLWRGGKQTEKGEQ